MDLSQLLDKAIQGDQIDTDSSQWVDFIFELLKQQPTADEIDLLRQREPRFNNNPASSRRVRGTEEPAREAALS